MAMSGITVDDEVGTVFQEMKLRREFRWAIFKIKDNKSVVLDTKATGDQGFTELYASLKESGEPRYALYDVPQELGVRSDKLVFLFWCLDSFSAPQKMIYASTKDTVKQVFTGLGSEILISEDDAGYVQNELIREAKKAE
ncbi:cofilin-like [Patiria miniata]|uniref:ADF-H domain-containing protein n=1 Tax=Patiria miniata TaxID=46514 RepID=A0A914APY3_PATMI|nr:cofilin-like [Patiria miniata]